MNAKEDTLLEDRIANLQSSYHHPPYILEKKLVMYIQQKDEKNSLVTLNQINQLERAHLSDSPLRSMKDSIIGSCTLFTRAVIEAGVDSETSFMMSDSFIRRVEECRTVAETEQLEYEMLKKFIDLLKKEGLFNYGPIVNKAISFIKQNVQHKLSLKDIAESVNVHPNYLSSLFKKEVGISMSAFIEKQKAEAISLFLTETDLSLTDIAFTFEFSSIAYFSGYFKRIFKVSPIKYRYMHSKHG